MTPEKLREKGNRWRELGQYDLANIYNQHAAALEEIERLQAKVDALMLEYCPDEMTPEQLAEWEKHQRAVPAESAR